MISQGKQLTGTKALGERPGARIGGDEEQMAEKAKAWIRANPEAKQPWEQPGYSIPGGGPSDPATQGLTYFGPVNVMVQTKGNMPAQQVIMAAVIDTARVDYDTAHEIEARYFQRLLLDQVSRNMMTTFFVQMNELDAGASRPDGCRKDRGEKTGHPRCGRNGRRHRICRRQGGHRGGAQGPHPGKRGDGQGLRGHCL